MATAEATAAVLQAREEIKENPEESTLRKWAETLAAFVAVGALTQQDITTALVSAWVAATGSKGTAAREIARGLRDGGQEVEINKTEIARADLEEAASEVAGASTGTRHDTLYERAAFMGKHVRAGSISAAEVRSRLMGAWRSATSNRDKEGVRTINDGLGDARGAFEYAQEPEQGYAWVDIFKVGEEVHKGGHIVGLDRDFIVQMMSNFERLRDEGYETVVLREHEREGHVFGFVHRLRLFEGYLQAKLEFLRPDDRIAYNNGQLRRFSPGFALNFQHPHTGEEMGPTLLEVSFVAMPFQTNLRPPQDTNPDVRLAFNHSGEILTGETTMANEAKTEEPVVEPVEASDVELAGEEEEEVDMMGEMYGLMKKMYALMAPDEEEEEEGDEEMNDKDREIRNLSAKVSRLEDERTRMELKALGVPADKHDALVKLNRADVDLYASTVEMLSQTAETTQRPIGRTGDAEVTGKPTAGEILAKAEEAGVKYGRGLTTWLAKNHPERVQDVLSVVRD